jgi:lipase maturation factor
MPDLVAPDYEFARFVIERGLATLYLIAFVVAFVQFPALSGERGLEPVRGVLAVSSFRRAPSLFHFGYSDRRLRVVSVVGAVVGVGLLIGVVQQLPLPLTMLAWFVLWVLYSSIVNVGGTFYSFGWETLLLEAGFLAIFLGNATTPPLWPVILLYRWLAFRVEFGAGLIKLRGDRCWRELTCMYWHHETQPMPNPLSWFFHHLPGPIHRIEVIGNFAAQLVLPFGLFLPQPGATIAAVLMIGTQLYLVVSGNYAWLNWVTIVILAAGIGDGAVEALLGFVPGASARAAVAPTWFVIAVLALTALVVALSWFPVRNMLSPHQMMNASFDPFRLVNTYGAFGSVSRERYEVVVEGTAEDDPGPDAEWREYEFKGKPGDPARVPRQVAPYHLRLDWLMWFLPLSRAYGEGWFMPFLAGLLRGDRSVLGLLRYNPFADRPPALIRARLYRYRYTSWRELRATGRWWSRELVGDFVGPVRLREGG